MGNFQQRYTEAELDAFRKRSEMKRNCPLKEGHYVTYAQHDSTLDCKLGFGVVDRIISETQVEVHWNLGGHEPGLSTEESIGLRTVLHVDDLIPIGRENLKELRRFAQYMDSAGETVGTPDQHIINYLREERETFQPWR